MKVCPNCKKENDDTAEFCCGCGSSLNVEDDSSEAKQNSGALKNCPHCGAPVSDGALFCGKCGKKIESDAPVLFENDTYLNKRDLGVQYAGLRDLGICFTVMAAVLLVITVLISWNNAVNDRETTGDIAIWVALLVMVIFSVGSFIFYNKCISNPLFSGAKHQRYRFYTTGMLATYMDGEREISSEMVPYEFIVKLQRRKHLLAIYISNGTRCLLVNQSKLSMNEKNELDNFLRQKCLPTATKTLK